MNGAELLVKTMITSGIDVCFANFGTSEITLVAALDSVPGIRAVPTLFEGVCTGAADGYGRMKAKPAMTLLHLGVGLANGLANLHNAKRAHTPMINVVGQLATWHLPWDSLEQTDIQGLAGPVSEWVRVCSSASRISQDTADAIAAASQGKVATLIVPQDCQWDECSELRIAEPSIAPNRPNEAVIKEAAKLLREDPNALLLLGGKGLLRRGLLAAFRIKAATGCEVLADTFVARMERGAGLPAIGRIAYFPEQAVAQLARYKSVVLAGTREPIATFAYREGRSRFLDDDHVTIQIADGLGDAEEALDLLADLLGADNTTKSTIRHQKAQHRSEIPKGPLNAETVCRTLAALQPEHAVIVDEAITSGWAYHALAADLPPHTLLGLTGGAIGQGIPCATGAAIACPDRQVINLQADGSAMYTVQALWTQAREQLDVTTLICSNRSYNILKVEMARAGRVPMGKHALTLTDLNSPFIDWVQLSQGLGVPAVSVTTSEELARELQRALTEPGPQLIEMVFDR